MSAVQPSLLPCVECGVCVETVSISIISMSLEAREQLKAELKASPTFKAELKERLKTALALKLPASKPIQYNFDS